MVNIPTERLLTRPSRKVLEDLGEGVLDPADALMQGYLELNELYISAGKDKSSVGRDPRFNAQEERYSVLLNYIKEEGGDTSFYDEIHREILDGIERDSKQERGSLGSLVQEGSVEKLKSVSLDRMQKKYVQMSTIAGCAELMYSFALLVTPENRKNCFGKFLGVYQKYETLLGVIESEGADVSEDRSFGLNLFKQAENAFYGNLSMRKVITNNSRCLNQ